MSYNPTRMNPNQNLARRKRRLDPRAGSRRSEIISRQGPQGTSSENLHKRKETDRGWVIDYFKNDNFEVSYQYWASNNTTGKIKHPTKDRIIKVLYGKFSVSEFDEERKIPLTQETIGQGSVFVAEKGMCYELASFGDSDVELLIIQDHNYDDDLEQITESFSSNQTKTTLTVTETSVRQRRTESSKAMQQAQMMQYQKQLRQRQLGKSTKIDNPNADAVLARSGRQRTDQLLPGQTVLGVNPQPMGMRAALDGLDEG